MLKKLLILLFISFSFNLYAAEKQSTFTMKKFNDAQKIGKVIVIHSWDKNCLTCAKQVKMLNEAQKDFPNVVFLSYEQIKDKKIAKLLDVKYWTTIVVYKGKNEKAKEIGMVNKEDIYNLIRKEI